MNFRYLIPRIIRHYLPDAIARFLLRRGWIIRPGLETANPEEAAARYLEVLASAGVTLDEKRVLIFGYGGNFALGCALLAAGASHVVLCDRYAPPDDKRNAALLPRYDAYLTSDGIRVQPRPETLSLVQEDIRIVATHGELQPVDVVLSSSVFEHLDDVEGVSRALAFLTMPEGLQVHFIDLRDHFFAYPFEMLCYSERTWQRWLNPGSHHNRYRLRDYRKAFESAFARVEIQVLARDEAAFTQAQPRIRPEFLTGDALEDAVIQIQVLAASPRKGADRVAPSEEKTP